MWFCVNKISANAREVHLQTASIHSALWFCLPRFPLESKSRRYFQNREQPQKVGNRLAGEHKEKLHCCKLFRNVIDVPAPFGDKQFGSIEPSIWHSSRSWLAWKCIWITNHNCNLFASLSIAKKCKQKRHAIPYVLRDRKWIEMRILSCCTMLRACAEMFNWNDRHKY